MRLDKRTAVLAGLAIVGALLLAWGAKVVFFPDKGPEPVTATATVGRVEQAVMATGSLEPVNLVSVGAQVSGQVTRLHVVLGQQVRKGQLIAEIDSAPQRNALATAQASLNSIRAQREQMQGNLAKAELALRRQSLMLASEATSRADFEAAEAEARAARAQLASNEAQIAEAAVAVRSAQLDLGYTRIVAPIDGTIVAVVTKEGQTVNANQAAPTIVKLGDLSTMTVKAEISEADVVDVRPGQKVYFTILGDGDRRYNGVLSSVEPAPESIETSDTVSNASSSSTAIYYNGLFEVENADGRLRTFMTAQVTIVLAEADRAVTIPAAALGAKGKDGTYSVQVLDAEGVPRPRTVRIGLNNGAVAEVKSGVVAGDKVVVATQASPGAAAGASNERAGPPNAFGF